MTLGTAYIHIYESPCLTNRFNLSTDDLRMPRFRVHQPLACNVYLPFRTMVVSTDRCCYSGRSDIAAKSVSHGDDFQQIDDFEYE